MLALFFAQRVILGREKFEDVPRLLKEETYEILKESGMEHLAGDYQPNN